VQYRLPHHDIMLGTAIDEDPARARAGGNIDDLGWQDPALDLGGGLLQGTQAVVLAGKPSQQLQPALGEQQLFTQAFVLLDEITVRNEHVVNPVGNASGKVGNPINGRSQEPKAVPNPVQVIEAAVGEHDRHRKHHECGDAILKRYAFDK